MIDVTVLRQPGRHIAAEVRDLAGRSEATDGYRFLSDHLWLDLASPAGPALVARAVEKGTLVGYAQASRVQRGWVVEATTDPSIRSRKPDLIERLVRGIVDALGEGERDGHDQRVTWWTHDAGDADADLAGRLGLVLDRELLQLSRPLPMDRTASVVTRDFVVGNDEDAVLDVNNRAFAEHGEQGGWTVDTIRLREQEQWFDPSGFRLHERDGRLAAFCWTKLHPAAGEIYVIAVDPDFQGLGLGSELTLSGLDSIWSKGRSAALLYVDAGNRSAVGMYERLGFEVSRRDRAYSSAA